MRFCTLVPGTRTDARYLTYVRTGRVVDVEIANPFDRSTIPLPLLHGPDGRDVYVYWAHKVIEITEVDGRWLPVAEINVREDAA